MLIGTHKDTKIDRAIKRIKKSLIDPKNGKEGILQEFELLRQLDHPNVLKVIESFEDAQNLYIVTELLSGGELFDMLLKEAIFSEEKTAEIVK